MNCPCDKRVHPPELIIAAGLETIPRQIASFPDFRNAMLATLRSKTSLADWRARGEDDLGIMLLEMWAYVSDILAFYDEVIAHETYLRTARRRPSLRKLVGLLGYLSRPAVASSVKLAIFAEGRKPVSLPAGMAFRSGAFNGEPPQVFELNADIVIHPFTNSWTIESPRPTTIEVGDYSHLLLEPSTAKLKPEEIVLVQVANNIGQTQVRQVTSVTTIEGKDGNEYVQVNFDQPLNLAGNTSIANIKLSTPTQTASLWTLLKKGANPDAIENPSGPNTQLTLDGLYRQIKPGMFIIIEKDKEYRWFKVNSVIEERLEVSEASTITVSSTSITTPAVTVPVTRILLDTALNDSTRRPSGAEDWTDDHKAEIILHYGFVDGGKVTKETKTLLQPSDPLKLIGPIEVPESGKSPDSFLLEDKNQRGMKVSGRVNFTDGVLTLDEGTTWDPGLVIPVQANANIVTASRGEIVTGEVLGSGDASVANQSFKLKKKPLTYLASPTMDNELGVASTLKIYANGILWKEVTTFFGIGPSEQVYTIRQNDEGESIIMFGDGCRGARLPTGIDNVVAYYRYGAGAASPPAGSITQIAKPVKGVKSVKNPVAASGGGDAETSKNLRTYAPKSALILGRAVSIIDMEAVAAKVSGVRAVRARWHWHSSKQRPVVQVWYIGDPGIEASVSQNLRNLSEPSTPIDVEPAQGLPTELSLDLEIDPRYLEADVLADVRKILMDKDTGLLTPERIGIGQPLFRSQIFEAVIAVPGVTAIRGIHWNGVSFNSFAMSPGSGKYFDLEKGALVLNGKEGTGG